VPDVGELARRSDVIVSICPPHAALAVAEEVAAAVADREPPLYVEANAVSPDTVTAVAELLGPANVVDGAVIGPPGWERGTTVLWLAGARAQVVADLFADSPFDARVLGPRLGAASALKACFAVQSKAIPAAWCARSSPRRSRSCPPPPGGEGAASGRGPHKDQSGGPHRHDSGVSEDTRPVPFPTRRARSPGRVDRAERRLVSLATAPEYADVSTRTLRRYISHGRLTGYRVGPRLIKVDLNELDRLARPIPTAHRPG